jgi:hypothetical protein
MIGLPAAVAPVQQLVAYACCAAKGADEALGAAGTEAAAALKIEHSGGSGLIVMIALPAILAVQLVAAAVAITV